MARKKRKIRVSQELHEFFKRIGKKGGKAGGPAAAKSLTAEARKAGSQGRRSRGGIGSGTFGFMEAGNYRGRGPRQSRAHGPGSPHRGHVAMTEETVR